MQQKTTSKVMLLVLLFSTLFCYAVQPVFIQNSDKSKLSSSSGENYDCVDAWIIIGGDKPNHSHWDLVLRSTEWVYDRVID